MPNPTENVSGESVDETNKAPRTPEIKEGEIEDRVTALKGLIGEVDGDGNFCGSKGRSLPRRRRSL